MSDRRKKYLIVNGRRYWNWMRWPRTIEERRQAELNYICKTEEFKHMLYQMACNQPVYNYD